MVFSFSSFPGGERRRWQEKWGRLKEELSFFNHFTCHLCICRISRSTRIAARYVTKQQPCVSREQHHPPTVRPFVEDRKTENNGKSTLTRTRPFRSAIAFSFLKRISWMGLPSNQKKPLLTCFCAFKYSSHRNQ